MKSKYHCANCSFKTSSYCLTCGTPVCADCVFICGDSNCLKTYCYEHQPTDANPCAHMLTLSLKDMFCFNEFQRTNKLMKKEEDTIRVTIHVSFKPDLWVIGKISEQKAIFKNESGQSAYFNMEFPRSRHFDVYLITVKEVNSEFDFVGSTHSEETAKSYCKRNFEILQKEERFNCCFMIMKENYFYGFPERPEHPFFDETIDKLVDFKPFPEGTLALDPNEKVTVWKFKEKDANFEGVFVNEFEVPTLAYSWIIDNKESGFFYTVKGQSAVETLTH